MYTFTGTGSLGNSKCNIYTFKAGGARHRFLLLRTGTARQQNIPLSVLNCNDNEQAFLRQTKTKTQRRGASHKAGFTCRKAKGVRTIVRTPFHTPCSARYSVLHLSGELLGGNEPPLCKGRWLA